MADTKKTMENFLTDSGYDAAAHKFSEKLAPQVSEFYDEMIAQGAPTTVMIAAHWEFFMNSMAHCLKTTYHGNNKWIAEEMLRAMALVLVPHITRKIELLGEPPDKKDLN